MLCNLLVAFIYREQGGRQGTTALNEPKIETVVVLHPTEISEESYNNSTERERDIYRKDNIYLSHSSMFVCLGIYFQQRDGGVHTNGRSERTGGGTTT